jgi:hypothetical protein
LIGILDSEVAGSGREDAGVFGHQQHDNGDHDEQQDLQRR